MTIRRFLILMALMLLVTRAFQPSAHAAEGLELGLTARQGTSSSQAYTLDYDHKAGPVDLNASYRYVETNGEITTRQGSTGGVYNYEISNRLNWWSSMQGSFNEQRSIDGELFTALGLTRYLVKNDMTRLSLSAGYLLQYTDYEDRASVATHRMSYRLKASHRAGNTECGAYFFYQPSLQEPDNYFTKSKAACRVELEQGSMAAFKYSVALVALVEDSYRSFAEGARHETLEFIGLKVRFTS